MESKMLYASELHKYKNTMESIIDDAELAVEFNLMLQKPFPEVFKPEKTAHDKINKINKPLNYIEKKQRFVQINILCQFNCYNLFC